MCDLNVTARTYDYQTEFKYITREAIAFDLINKVDFVACVNLADFLKVKNVENWCCSRMFAESNCLLNDEVFSNVVFIQFVLRDEEAVKAASKDRVFLNSGFIKNKTRIKKKNPY